MLEEYLDAHSMKQAELADRTGLTPKTINEIIKGKAPITPETALKLQRVPVKDMAKLGWIAQHKGRLEQIEALLRFFGVASTGQWRTVWENYQVAYRQSQRFETHAEAVSAWLRRGELEAQRIACAPYDKRSFLAALQTARALTREPPKCFRKR